jgi:hypothetical protein
VRGRKRHLLVDTRGLLLVGPNHYPRARHPGEWASWTRRSDEWLRGQVRLITMWLASGKDSTQTAGTGIY